MSALYFFFLMIRRPPRSTLFPTRRSSDLLRAWFVDDATRMSPHLLYAQAIKGRFTGRGTGIIDTLHFVEVARAAGQLDLKPADLSGVQKWFAGYIEWLTTHPYGVAERDAQNNHGTCWCTQVAAFAQLTG